MRQIKRLIMITIMLFFGLIVAVLFSLKGERDYMDNCEKLGIHCEEGNVQKFSDKVKVWLKKKADELN